jgi:L-aminopeptidase/D-esterase-like protein
MKGGARANTTLCVVATEAMLTKPQCAQLATMASAGLARAINPVFRRSTATSSLPRATGASARSPIPLRDLARIGAAAADCLARAIARGVYEAKSLPGGLPSWKEFRFGS